jgi:tetratricopeptide (TPR) repeat protein
MRPPRDGRSRLTKRRTSTRINSLLREYQSLKTTLISNMKRGSFTPSDLLEPARRMETLLPRVFGSRRSKQARAEQLKIRAYISEIYYFFDLKEEARNVLAHTGVERVPIELFNRAEKFSPNDSVLNREKIRAYLAYLQAHHYVAEDYDNAAIEFERCAEFIKDKLMRDHGFHSDSTLALCYYNLGRALRQGSKHDEALRAFGNALTYFHRRYRSRLKMFDEKEARLRRRKNRPSASIEQLRERRKDETMMFHHRSGLVFGRGMAWSNYASAELLPALTENIVPAAAFFDETKDEISKSYLKLIESTILRNLPEDEHRSERAENLRRAEQLLKEAITTFQEYKHKTYESRALYELSIVLLYNHQFDSALKQINKVIERVANRSPRWHANSLVYRARILSYGAQQTSWTPEKRKEQLLRALKDAQDAALEAPSQAVCKMDSLVVQADIYLKLVDLSDKSSQARADFRLRDADEVLDKLFKLNANKRNPRFDAYYYLYKTLHSLHRSNLDEAAKFSSTWLAIKPQVKDDWTINELAKQVEEKSNQLKDRIFNVRILDFPDDPDAFKAQFDFRRLQEELMVHLKKQAGLRGVRDLHKFWELADINKSLYYSVMGRKARSRKRG